LAISIGLIVSERPVFGRCRAVGDELDGSVDLRCRRSECQDRGTVRMIISAAYGAAAP
jgi:hypothetical protein